MTALEGKVPQSHRKKQPSDYIDPANVDESSNEEDNCSVV